MINNMPSNAKSDNNPDYQDPYMDNINLSSMMFRILFFLEGILFVICAVIYNGHKQDNSLMTFGVWVVGFIVTTIMRKSHNRTIIIGYKVIMITLITLFGTCGAMITHNTYIAIISYELEWISCIMSFTKKECRLLLAEQLFFLIARVSSVSIFAGKEIDYPATIFLIVLLIVSEWMVKTNINDRLENQTRGMIQHRSSEDLIKVVEAKCYEARSATKSKSNFLANMSHEIRTPINAVMGLDEMILRETDDDAIRGYAHDIKTASVTLLNIINDILDFSKIESGKMELVLVSYDISSVINDLVNMINVKAIDKGLSFKLSVDENLPILLNGDEVRIKQIITNVLTNAVKYTESGSVFLKIGYDKIDNDSIMLHVSVEDTGMGMRREEMDKLFRPFERIDEESNRNIEGTGLGMSITKNFLNMMGSELEVQSIYGTGSVFSFSVVQKVDCWDPMGNYEEAFKRLRSQTEVKHVAFVAPEAKVLVVDDIMMNLTVFKGLLKESNMKVDTALTGKQAVELCNNNHYHMIFLDHMMPEMDGIQTFEQIRANKNSPNKDTPVIILTANAVSGSREKYMAVGFDDYLTKPIDTERLEKQILHFIPDELVSFVDEDSISNNKENNMEQLDYQGDISKEMNDGDMLSKLSEIPYISTQEGIKTLGDKDLYLEIMKEFGISAASKVDLIRGYYQENDIRNYTIQVHSLKSSARMIGDNELSDMAMKLEAAGNENDIETIQSDTDVLLERYSVLGKLICSIVSSFEVDDEDKPLIEKSKIDEMMKIIQISLDEFDFDTIDAIMEEMSSYRMPEDFQDTYRQCKLYVSDVDLDALEELVHHYFL